MASINCDVVNLICDPTDTQNPCSRCENNTNYVCAETPDVRGQYKCTRKVQIDFNPLLEYLFLDPVSKAVEYKCRYPEFVSNGGDLTKPCRIIHACAPSGFLYEISTGRQVTSASQIRGSLSDYECECGSAHIPYFFEYPRCKITNVEELLDNFQEYSKYDCVGFPKSLRGGCECPEGFVSNKDEKELTALGYRSTTAYDLQLLPKTCVRKPCQFDPSTGQYLGLGGRARWDADLKSCQCDTSYGLMGVFVDEAGAGNAVDVKSEKDGFNACVSVNRTDKLYGYYSYLRYYVDLPGGHPAFFYFSKEPDVDRFTTVKDSLDKYKSSNPDYKNAALYFQPVYTGNPKFYVPTFNYEYPLDLKTMKTSVEDRRRLQMDKPDSLFFKIDDTYEDPFYKVGDVVRNPATYDLETEGSIINPFLSVAADAVGILNFDDEKVKNSDLIGVPHKKRPKKDA